MPKKSQAAVQLALPASLPSPLYHHNQRLFSDYFLDSILTSEDWPGKDAWQNVLVEAAPVMAALHARYTQFVRSASAANEAQTEIAWIRPVLETLGHTFDVQASLKEPGTTPAQRPDYVFYASEDQLVANRGHALDERAQHAGAFAVGDAKRWDAPLDQMRRGASDALSNKNPSFQIFFDMLQSALPWGILTNGRLWRLYHHSTAYKLDVYYEVDLPDLLASDDVERFCYFYAFFRRTAFQPTHPLSLDRMLSASLASAQQIRDDLHEQVYDALRLIAQGFLSYPSNHLSPTPQTCQQIYEQSLILLYRLLFIFYAESRDLLPMDNEEYERRYSLRTIAHQVRLALQEKAVLLPYVGILWAQLQAIFNSIDRGERALEISTFNGGLFRSEHQTFLETYRVGDRDLAGAIDKLARRPQDALDFAADSLIDYRDLSERHLGTIYEGLLAYTLQVASEPMVELRSSHRIVPQTQASGQDVVRIYDTGEVYLITDAGQRKTTGSYYTPDYIVKYLAEHTLKPLLDAAVDNHPGDEERIQAVLAINVLDPAMGSGHFLVEVVEYMARYLVELGISPQDKGEQVADLLYWKRRVAQQCIYGVDSNPLAVELARLSLWLATAARGYPLRFLDHHLRAGNALVGAWLAEGATSEHPRARVAKKRASSLPVLTAQAAQEQAEVVQFSIFEDQAFNDSLSTALQITRRIEQIPGNTLQEVKQQEAAYASLRTHFVSKYQDLLDLRTAALAGLEIEHWAACAAYAIKPSESRPYAEQFAQIVERARMMSRQKRFFHWELEFPEIFFEHDGTPGGDRAGFDAVVGNPPYVRQEKISPEKPFYQEQYEVAHGSADLFVYFFEQGLRLLRPGGRLAYISSNSWLRAHYATPLRRFLRQHTDVEQIIDLGDTRVFPAAPDMTPALQIVRKQPPEESSSARVALFSRSDTIRDFHENLDERFVDIFIQDQPDEGWQLTHDTSRHLLARLMTTGRPLGDVVNTCLYRGALTGLNEAFFIDAATRTYLINTDPDSVQLLRPLVRGEDLRPWYQEDEGRWLIFAHRGIDIAAYPAIQAHLERFRARLEPRPKATGPEDVWQGRKPGSYKWYELQDAIEYSQEFSKPKIFWADIAKYPRFSWNEKGLFCNDKGFFLRTPDQALLGILQSRTIWYCISHLCAPLGERSGGMRYQHKIQYIERLPIPVLSDDQHAQLRRLAQRLTSVAQERYRIRKDVTHRMRSDLGNSRSKMTDRLDEWWRLDWQEVRNEVRKSFKREIPFKERGEWQAYFQEQRDEIERRTAEMVRLERELNASVYAVYGLNEQEIALIERETRYQYGQW